MESINIVSRALLQLSRKKQEISTPHPLFSLYGPCGRISSKVDIPGLERSIFHQNVFSTTKQAKKVLWG